MGHKCCITNVKLVMHIYHCHIRDESFFCGSSSPHSRHLERQCKSCFCIMVHVEWEDVLPTFGSYSDYCARRQYTYSL